MGKSPYKEKWVNQRWPNEINDDTELDPEKFYIYMQIVDIGPAGYGTDAGWTFPFDDEKDFCAFLKYLLVPNYISIYGVDSIDIKDYDNYENEIHQFFNEFDVEPEKEKALIELSRLTGTFIEESEGSIDEIIDLFHDVFLGEGLNPSYHIVAYGLLTDYFEMLVEETSRDDGVLEYKYLSAVKSFLIALNQEA